MFELIDPEDLTGVDDAGLVALIAESTRAENSAAGTRMAAVAELLTRHQSEDDPRWAFDAHAATTADVGAAMGISPRRAATVVNSAEALRDRLPRVAERLRAGDISERVVKAMCWRTHLVNESAAVAVDNALAAAAGGAGTLSETALTAEIDTAINAFDPDAVRRVHYNASLRDIRFGKPDDQTGARSVYGSMCTADADWLERRINALAATVCAEDPRRMGERRADAMRVAATGADTLPCRCNRPECPQNSSDATDGSGVVDRTRAGTVVIHVLADQAAIDAAIREAATQPSIGTPWLEAHKPTEVYFPQSDWVEMYTFLDMETILEHSLVVHDHWNPPQGPVTAAAAARGEQTLPVRRDFGSNLLDRSKLAGKRRNKPRTAECRRPAASARDGFDVSPTPPPQSRRTPRQWPRPRDPAPTGNAVILGGGFLTTPELAELVRTGATITALRPIGEAPEPRHQPSDRLSWFIRARDLTCSFPGCDRPAERCDLDHVEPYPRGPTHPGNLTARCRIHHIAKTHHGWAARQIADGTAVWISPTGHTYAKRPLTRSLFPRWDTATPLPGGRVADSTAAGSGHTSRSDPSNPAIPARRRTRAADRRTRIDARRAENHFLNSIGRRKALRSNRARFAAFGPPPPDTGPQEPPPF